MSKDINFSVDYVAVLADLKAKREAIDKTIAGVEQMLGQAPSGMVSTIPVGASEDIKDDSFFGMSIAEATKKLLSMKKKPLSTQDIADILIRGGMTHSSEKFANTVGAGLNRLDKNDGGIVNISRGKWGLAEWYPGKRKNKKNDAEEEKTE